LIAWLACSRAPAPAADAAPPAGPLALQGGVVVGTGPADLLIEEGRITAVGTVDTEGATVVDVSGRFLVPAAIDSHVHLAYLPQADAMADGGVAAAVDLASPIGWLATRPTVPRILASGPMVTAVDGYPVTSWGAGGYGTECADAAAAAAAVASHHAAGAQVVKLPITGPPVLDEAARLAAVEAAHGLGLDVVSHALGDGDAAAAAAAGVDWLAHTPTGPLSEATVAAWAGRGVISTLRAFGGSETAVANLAALRAAGAVVLYGTDFGNTATAGVDGEEIALLQRAGLTSAEILASMTSSPAAAWGWTDLGVIEPGRAASLLVLTEDPLVDPTALARPDQVYLDGRLR
jgi:imidazolonepropionase-like amidohydrolase